MKKQEIRKRAKKEEDKPSDNNEPTRPGPVLRRKSSLADLLHSQLTKPSFTPSGRIQHITRRRIFFLVGSIIGFLISFLFVAHSTDQLPKELIQHFNSNNWSDYLNFEFEGPEWSKFLPDNIMIDELVGNFTGKMMPNQKAQNDLGGSPGLKLREQGAIPKHPVIFIPGIISTGLESWGVDNCSKKYFRKRLWGTMTMFRSVLTDKECWIESMKLDPVSGLDNPGYKLRAAQGLDAADYFVTGYWVWAKFIENFASVGYDNNNMHLAAYDWRLSYDNLELRDLYFTKLKNTIELAKLGNNEKAVVLTHSMGSSVWYYFLKWVESDLGGKGGDQWVDQHIHATVNIAGALLGALKTIPTLLSGEQRETVQPMAQYILESYLSRDQRARMFRSWGGLWSLLPKGGDLVWGSHTSAPDDQTNPGQVSVGNVFLFSGNSTVGHNFTVEQALNLLYVSAGNQFASNLKKSYSFGAALKEKDLLNNSPSAWSNPLQTSLPKAPNMKFYCFYGHGLDTERAYHLKETEAIENLDELQLPFVIDNQVNDQDNKVLSGIKSGLGDGSVQLLSLGYMCVEGWKKPRFNPSNLKVITREFNHTVVPMYEDLRGGPDTGEHIDILGNHQVIEEIIRIAVGVNDSFIDNIQSDIVNISKRVPL